MNCFSSPNKIFWNGRRWSKHVQKSWAILAWHHEEFIFSEVFRCSSGLDPWPCSGLHGPLLNVLTCSHSESERESLFHIWLSWGRWGLAERRLLVMLFQDDSVCMCETSTSFWNCMPSSTFCQTSVCVAVEVMECLWAYLEKTRWFSWKLENWGTKLQCFTQTKGCDMVLVYLTWWTRGSWLGIILIITTGSSYKAQCIFTFLSREWMTSEIWNRC